MTSIHLLAPVHKAARRDHEQERISRSRALLDQVVHDRLVRIEVLDQHHGIFDCLLGNFHIHFIYQIPTVCTT